MSDALKSSNTFCHRVATAAEFTSDNPILALSEFGYESDTGAYKIGNGVTAWTSLSYVGSGSPATAHAAVVATGATQTTPFGYATAAQANDIVTLVNQIRAALVARGIMV